jgi:hypothetical protein
LWLKVFDRVLARVAYDGKVGADRHYVAFPDMELDHSR